MSIYQYDKDWSTVKCFEIQPGDIFTYLTTEDALKDMEKLAKNNIHCVLHNIWNGHINKSIEIISLGDNK